MGALAIDNAAALPPVEAQAKASLGGDANGFPHVELFVDASCLVELEVQGRFPLVVLDVKGDARI